MSLADWQGCEPPSLRRIEGQYITIEPLSDGHADGLIKALGGPQNDPLWTYIPMGPFPDAASLMAGFAYARDQLGWATHVFLDPKTGSIEGTSSYMRIRPEHGSAEIGCVMFSRNLQRTAGATEAMYLMARHLFDDLGYRRYEWKCNDENAASKAAALRLGFTYEGTFRNDMVVKGLNRDTAWYSMTDEEWPTRKAALKAWLSPSNIGDDGQQLQSLASLRVALSAEEEA